ncbi:MAG: hypothetical protein R2932_31995 [Caldilineaceae bacterium]
MRILQVTIALVFMLAMTTTSTVSGQAYPLSFDTSITFQNVGTSATTVTFNFYNQGSSQARTDTKNLNAKAGDSYAISSSTSVVPSGFWGSARLSANQTIVATLVHLPPSNSGLKNRPLSNASGVGSSQILIPTLLKNKFNTTSKFSIQNLSSDNIDITVDIYNADNPTAAPITVSAMTLHLGFPLILIWVIAPLFQLPQTILMVLPSLVALRVVLPSCR